MASPGLVVAGVGIALLAGLFNSTWSIPSKPAAPAVLRVVATPVDWEWEHLWAAFTFLSIVVNIVVVLPIIDPKDLGEIYRDGGTEAFTLAVLFSFIWGFGTLLLSVSVQLLGAGLGMSISIITTLVFGTLLPLIVLYPEAFATAGGALTLLGTAIATVGIGLTAKASMLRDGPGANQAAAEAEVPLRGGGRDVETPDEAATDGTSKVLEVAAPEPPSACSSDHKSIPNPKPDPNPSPNPYPNPAPPRARGVLVALTAGIVSALLQFAFVFGLPLSDAAEDAGYAPLAAPLVIWFIAFPVSGAPNLAVALGLIWRRGTFRRFWTGRAEEQLKNWERTLFAATLFVAHIHGYGVGQALLGDLGVAIMWPLLMASTMVMGQLWGYGLGEWDGADPRAVRLNMTAIAVIIVAIAVLTGAGLASLA